MFLSDHQLQIKTFRQKFILLKAISFCNYYTKRNAYQYKILKLLKYMTSEHNFESIIKIGDLLFASFSSVVRTPLLFSDVR